MPAPIRKAAETKTTLFPTLAQMLMEITEDEAEWQQEVEDYQNLGTTPVQTAQNTIVRLSGDLGEKTTLASCQPLITQCIHSD